MGRPGFAIAVVWLSLSAVVIGLAHSHAQTPGIYYDEVVQALPALELLDPERAPSPLPGARTVEVFGRQLPWMTQSYMGALKSWLLAPVFALAGASSESLRLATLMLGLLGVLFTMLAAQRLFGLPAALLAGTWLALDPSILFTARHDWGSFATGFALRSSGLFAALEALRREGSGAQRGSRAWAFGAGVCLGLAFYNKIDFAAFAVACAAGVLACGPSRLLAGLRARLPLALAGAAGFALGGIPMLAALPEALRTTLRFARSGSGAADGFSEKLHALWWTWDGSYYERLFASGGRFDALGEVAVFTPPCFALAFALAAVWLLLPNRDAADAWPPTRNGSPAVLDTRDIARFLAVAAVLAQLALLAMPRANRIHHVLGAAPLPHLVVAGAVACWLGSRSPARRWAAAALAALLLISSVRSDWRSFSILEATGGRGRWSAAVVELGEALADEAPGHAGSSPRAVSLGWGLHTPLRFAVPRLAAEEPFWQLLQPAGPQGIHRRRGAPGDVYLVPDPRYAVFPLAAEFLAAVDALPGGLAERSRHGDRTGDVAFESVRIRRPHVLRYRPADRGRGGRFEIRLR